ncbi:MAG: nitrilase-related carbon-nitrogen hydrolase [Oscillospiraceae bacterium]|nr:nitrilase-related carbon-nitrogen hydrolase [Oscillospiraceae bacterium]
MQKEQKTGYSAEPALKKYLAAAITCDPKLKMKEQNIAEQCALVEEAARNGAKLIALPEMSTTGYCWYDREEIRPYVEPVPGPTTETFGEIAKKYDCWIVVGLPEVDPRTDIYYNTAALIGPGGLVGIHRKTHNYVCEGRWAKQGDVGHKVYDTPIGKIGLLVCMDINIMETSRLEGIAGADVIVSISNWVEDKTPAMTWYTRAYENGCYVLSTDRSGRERGTEFNGGGCLINPDGKLLCRADAGTCIAYGEVDLDKARDKSFEGFGHKLKDRRPRDYMDITLDPYLWDPLLGHGLYGHDPLPAGKVSKVAVAQFAPKPRDLEANLQRIETKIKTLTASGAELIVFPELTLTGFVSAQEAKALADTVPGKATDRLLDMCYKYRVYLVIGLIEEDDGALYNTAVLYSPEGVLGKYRKLHLDALDEGWATQGNLGINYFNTVMGRIGIMIGHDANFPEEARIHALHGVDILCCPAAVSSPVPEALAETKTWHKNVEPYGYTNLWWHLWRVRAGENNCYLAFANAVGKLPDGRECFGRSGIFQPMIWVFPRNEVVLGKGAEDSAVLTIDTRSSIDGDTPTGHTRKKYLMPMRRTIWYDTLVTQD